MKSVFLLHHVHRMPNDDEDVKLIGVYSSRETAEAAVARLADRPGFRDHVDEFEVDEYEIDKDNWPGFT